MSEAARRVILRPQVAENLEQQVMYLDAHASPDVGDRYLAAVNAAFDRLAETPGVGALREQLNSPISRSISSTGRAGKPSR
jgi:plasmid stabilization system protein ParE